MYEIISTVMEPGPDGCKPRCVTWSYDGVMESSTKQRKDNKLLITLATLSCYNFQNSDLRSVTTTGFSQFLERYPQWLMLRIAELEVQVNEEYRVYDFTGILGSVGGSLGLFIGFSFLDMILHILDQAWRYRCGKK